MSVVCAGAGRLQIEEEGSPYHGKVREVLAIDAKDPSLAFKTGYGALLDAEFDETGEGHRDMMDLRPTLRMYHKT